MGIIKLGKPYQDMVTGFRGIAVSRIEYYKGTPRVELVHTTGEVGKVPASAWFEEDRLMDMA